MPYLEDMQKIYINQVTHPLNPADISIFSPEITDVFCIAKIR